MKYLLEVDRCHAKLKQAAATADGSAGTVLGRDFFRDKVSRFQYQSGAVDYGTSQPVVSAREDAVANNVPSAVSVRSWLNLTRVAFHLGLKRLSAHKGAFGPEKPSISVDGALTTITPGNVGFEEGKAVALDRLAQGIKGVQAFGENVIQVSTGTQTLTVPIADFDLNAMANWIRRFSDAPDKLDRSPKGVRFRSEGDKNNFGVDLILEVQFQVGDAREAMMTFLSNRDAIRVRVIRVGDGISFNREAELKAGDERPLSEVRIAIERALAVVGKKDHTLVLRPIFAPQLAGADPGGFAYTVVKMHRADQLEWWHLELQPANDNETWLDFAENFGLDTLSLLAPDIPAANKPQTDADPTPWMGGGRAKEGKAPSLERQTQEPGNQQGQLKRPT